MEISKKNFTHYILSYLRIIEVSTFLFANLIIASIFWLLIDYSSPYVLVIYVIALLMSILILKNNWVFLLLYRNKNDEVSGKGEPTSDASSIKVSLKSFFIVIFKQLFFNISYELFPLLVIWICWFGLWYIFINFSSPYLGNAIDLFKFYPNSSFFQVITILGILLGVYQFYLSRQEQKIVSKINLNTDRIKQKIWKETTFEKYYSFISSRNESAFVKWVIDVTDPKMTYLNFFKEIRSDPEIFEGFKKLFFPPRQDRRLRQPIMNINLGYKDSNQKFEAIESRAIFDKHQIALEKSYVDFFSKDNKIDEIMSEVNKEINTNEFYILILSNINIVQEVIPDFIGEEFSKHLGDSLGSKDETNKLFDKCETASDYRQSLEVAVFQKIFNKISD